jgi:CRP-like cAMP-binding protein
MLRRRFSDARFIPAEKGPDRPGGLVQMRAIDPGPASNKLLAALPRTDFQLLAPQLTTLQLAQGTMLYEAGDEVDEVYFPLSGMVSMVVVMRDGKAIETATVGREGVVGAMSGLGLRISRVRAMVQLPIFASRISSPQLRKAVASSKPISDLCIRYNEVLLEQARITAACNALHQIEARFCRWLLQTRDRGETDTIKLTQEFLAEMLGVRRPSVSEVASKIQADGAISYSRGVIKILDLEALKGMSCECYEALQNQTS